jgi:dolichol-phosphate mannosyltransferase
MESQLLPVELGARPAPELSVIVPTLNERDNIDPLLRRLERVLAPVAWEVIFVDDDSTDGTVEHVRRIAREDARVRLLQRLGRRGLSTACIEGALASSAPYIAVMDADLQHEEALLPDMLDSLKSKPLDLVVASRHIEGGGLGHWAPRRIAISRFATRLSRLIVKQDLSDPMSGFFMIRREAFERAVRNLSGQGFKILLDLFASSPEPLRFEERPYVFRERLSGQSKLDTNVAWEFAILLGDKLVGHIVPIRFLMFAFIGGLGLLVHLAALGIAFRSLGLTFAVSQAAATLAAMTFNFLLNNMFTYRDQRLRGSRLLWGLLTFYLVCSIGAVANVGIAQVVYQSENGWLLAGAAGAIVGAVWNYALTSLFTWNRSAARAR